MGNSRGKEMLVYLNRPNLTLFAAAFFNSYFDFFLVHQLNI